ncbi:regulator of sigma E protease [Tissierella praeacuta DSM 18095]|uniref:Zinc metalloprotease n=1 Tax=Tissierella praeacuta DSM 18095 TaxID=1123404 RepID=A0A1M4SJ89_9FIRM|nr:RIP metalloprotease RseP [Tissierella praeacuta]SHE32256.1 regulator of sigma E protease [Tissierella praeacuta DSM 18095]SUP01481.1 Zinc metalloprotease rasP [Tissierella praeacuta]
MLTAISAVFVFLVVILVHEFGHFSVAKIVGIKVNEFSIGMGPKLFQKKKGETEYTLRALPIGGYVKMEGEDEASNDPRSFNKVSALSRIAVVAAGAIMNFVLAIVILTIVSYGIGMPTNIIDNTVPGSPAEKSGLISGDIIININGVEINNWDTTVDSINKSDPNKEMEIGIKRDNEIRKIMVKPITEKGKTIIGIVPKYEKSISSAIKGGFENTFMFLKLMFEFIGMIFKGKVGIKHLSGPVGVIHEVGVQAKLGIYNLLYILGFISVNLGFFNLLPIPALDGSRIVFLLVELVRGKPIDPEKEGFIHFVGFILLISLMLIVTYRDLIKFNIFSR